MNVLHKFLLIKNIQNGYNEPSHLHVVRILFMQSFIHQQMEAKYTNHL